MRIRARGKNVSEFGLIEYPSWCDVEVTTDDGHPIPDIKSIKIRMREGHKPILALIEVYVSELDVTATPEVMP